MQELAVGAGRGAQGLPRASSRAHASDPAAASEAPLGHQGPRSMGAGAAPLRASGRAGASGDGGPAADPGRSRGKKGGYSGGGRFWEADAPAAGPASLDSSPLGPQEEASVPMQVPTAPALSSARADTMTKRRRMEAAATPPAWPWGGPAEVGAGADQRYPAAEPGSKNTYSGYPMRNGSHAEQVSWYPSGSDVARPIHGARQVLVPSSALGVTPWGIARSPWDDMQGKLPGLQPQAAPSVALPGRARRGLEAAPVRDWGAGLGWQQRPGWTQRDASWCDSTCKRLILRALASTCDHGH